MTLSFPLFHSKYSDLSLSPLNICDASEMLIHLNDEETVKYLIGPPFPISMEQVKSYIYFRPSIDGNQLAFAIRHHGRMIGEIGLDPLETRHSYELGYYLSRPYWNNGIMTIAVNTYLNEILPQMNIGEEVRIEAGYLLENSASGKVLKKSGFVEVGRDQRVKNGIEFEGVKMLRTFPGKEQLEDSH